MMAGRTRFDVVIGTDGSASGRAAVDAAARFPWPARAGAVLVVASRGVLEWSPAGRALAQGAVQRVGARALRVLRRRWPAAQSRYPLQSPSGALLAAARSARGGAIVVGSGGRGMLRRLLLGSVSRQVVQAAGCPVLVVKGRLTRARRFTIGVDGSRHSRRAAEVVARLSVPAGGRVTLVSVIEPIRVPSGGLMPTRIGGALRAEAARLAAERRRRLEGAQRKLGIRLRRAGWKVSEVVRTAAPLEGLLAEAKASRADVLVIGARGTGGIARLLLGSVAEGAMARAPMSVLVVR
jgi:nucleotide-binding universal stress UspA family protein